jgi:hypothetical protein
MMTFPGTVRSGFHTLLPVTDVLLPGLFHVQELIMSQRSFSIEKPLYSQLPDGFLAALLKFKYNV